MSRPLRLEFEGALYHVTSRGDRREPIFDDDADRRAWLDVFERSLERFEATAFAYCLMDNHYHFVVQTRQPNLSRLLRQINGVYTQYYNHRHAKVGHLFRGRFKGIVVDEEAYFLEVCRYVDLNPVRANIAKSVSTSNNTSVQIRNTQIRKDEAVASQVLAPLAGVKSANVPRRG